MWENQNNLMAENSLLEKLEGLQHKFEEISMLITDPAVIADMKRYIKLNKEYNELNKIMTAVKEYKTALTNISEAKEIYDKDRTPSYAKWQKPKSTIWNSNSGDGGKMLNFCSFRPIPKTIKMW